MIKEAKCMRGSKGKLVCVWSPVLHGEGCSTTACAVGIGMQYYTGKRVLIVNKSNRRSHMESFIEKDIKIKYSMDNLKIFYTGISAEHVATYATQVNQSLYMIAGSKLGNKAEGDAEFDRLFMERCREVFDIIIADIDTGVRCENKLFLELADKVLAIATPNEIVLDQLYNQVEHEKELEVFKRENTIHILNKLYEGWAESRVTAGYMNRYLLSSLFGLNYDGDILKSCCSDRTLYSFLIKEFKGQKGLYAIQLKEICSYLAEGLGIDVCSGEDTENGHLFRKMLRSSMF